MEQSDTPIKKAFRQLFRIFKNDIQPDGSWYDSDSNHSIDAAGMATLREMAKDAGLRPDEIEAS